MSDITYLHDKPLIVYGQTAADDYVTWVDTSDNNRIKRIAQEELLKVILGGKTIGGTGTGDITTNSGIQTLRNKTLLNPTFALTPPGGGTNENFTDEMLYKTLTLMDTLETAGIEDGARLVETAENITKQSFVAYFNQSSDGSGEIGISAFKLFTESGVDGTGRTIDLRSILVNVLELSVDVYKPVAGWTYELKPTTSYTLDTLAISSLANSTAYQVCVHFRVSE
jgi:hypothetical protein